MKSEIKILEYNLDAFINQVMCRRDRNQHRAWAIYELTIRSYVPDELDRNLSIEYSHYWHTGELTPDQFGEYLKEFKIKILEATRRTEHLRGA